MPDLKNRLDVQKLVFSVATGLTFLSAQAAKADLYMQFGTNKTCLQTAPFAQNFTSGSFGVLLRDGLIVLAPCVFDPSPIPFDPVVNPPLCPLGATGFIATGDADRDGVRDDLSYWSLASDIPAYYIEPYRPDLCLLAAAPASTLPRPLGLFRDDSVTSYYNIRTTSTLQYDQSRYELIRNYTGGNGELSRMKRDLPFGQYQFTYPALGRPDRPLALPVTLTPFIDPYQPTTTDRNFFRVTSGHWNAGVMEMDPRVINSITWQGNTRNFIRPGVDTLRFGIYDTTDTNITFPPSGELLIPNPLAPSYNLPPFFYDVGDEGTTHITFDRNQALSQVTYDVSRRLFQFKVKFIDTYSGTAAISYPLGTLPSKASASADLDGDKVSNLVEYAYQSSPKLAKIASGMTAETVKRLTPAPQAPGIPVVNATAGGVINSVTVTKKPGIISTATYSMVWTRQDPLFGPTVRTEALPAVIGTSSANWTLFAEDATTKVFVPLPFMSTDVDTFKTTVSYAVDVVPVPAVPTIIPAAGNVTQITINKVAGVGTSADYGLDSSTTGTTWTSEVLPTVVGASNARWKLVSEDALTKVLQPLVALPRPTYSFRSTLADNPTTAGTFTVALAGPNVASITILKRPYVGGSLTYGAESSTDGTRWTKEKFPTIVGLSNSRWTLVSDDEVSMVVQPAPGVIIASPPTRFRAAVKQNY